jgi:CBS domain-containing protein
MWMARDVVTVEPGTALAEAARLMAHHRIRRLPVVVPGPEGPRLLGIVTATDLWHAFPGDVNPFALHSGALERVAGRVGDVAHRDVATVRADEPIEAAAALMRERKVGGLPVVRDGRLVGLITESDVFRAFVSLFRAERAGLRVTFDASKCERPFVRVAELSAGLPLEVKSLVLSRQDELPVCVVRVEGPGGPAFVEALWAAGLRVLHVLETGPAGAR